MEKLKSSLKFESETVIRLKSILCVNRQILIRSQAVKQWVSNIEYNFLVA